MLTSLREGLQKGRCWGLRKLIIISSLPWGLEERSAGASWGLQRWQSSRWLFSTPQWYQLGLLELAALPWTLAHLNPTLLSPGWAASAANVNGFERESDPLGVCKTLVRKGGDGKRALVEGLREGLRAA